MTCPNSHDTCNAQTAQKAPESEPVTCSGARYSTTVILVAYASFPINSQRTVVIFSAHFQSVITSDQVLMFRIFISCTHASRSFTSRRVSEDRVPQQGSRPGVAREDVFSSNSVLSVHLGARSQVARFWFRFDDEAVGNFSTQPSCPNRQGPAVTVMVAVAASYRSKKLFLLRAVSTPFTRGASKVLRQAITVCYQKLLNLTGSQSILFNVSEGVVSNHSYNLVNSHCKGVDSSHCEDIVSSNYQVVVSTHFQDVVSSHCQDVVSSHCQGVYQQPLSGSCQQQLVKVLSAYIVKIMLTAVVRVLSAYIFMTLSAAIVKVFSADIVRMLSRYIVSVVSRHGRTGCCQQTLSGCCHDTLSG
ncbi:hypothetical protein RRG08_032538 [Elysia crispata]|uniref:Uncharacterized protein n=1 Tax=Elysia crispata TaxID=231223 RepID=A0AAE1DPF3_9GAST|nr:hypothetical protein RRG08_032538 [Elysia crispata]